MDDWKVRRLEGERIVEKNFYKDLKVWQLSIELIKDIYGKKT